MVTSVSFRPQVSLAPTVVQQSEARNCREKIEKVRTDARNNKISDISAMTQRVYFTSKLQDTKVPPVKYVEDVKTQQTQVAKPAENVATKQRTVTDVIRNFHNGKQMSKVEQSQVLTNQMNMLAASNMILHGLF